MRSRRFTTCSPRFAYAVGPAPGAVALTLDDGWRHLPLVAGSGLAAARRPGRVNGSEIGAPLPDRLVRNDHAAGEHESQHLPLLAWEPRDPLPQRKYMAPNEPYCGT